MEKNRQNDERTGSSASSYIVGGQMTSEQCRAGNFAKSR